MNPDISVIRGNITNHPGTAVVPGGGIPFQAETRLACGEDLTDSRSGFWTATESTKSLRMTDLPRVLQ
jgi:hypothetical protein